MSRNKGKGAKRHFGTLWDFFFFDFWRAKSLAKLFQKIAKIDIGQSENSLALVFKEISLDLKSIGVQRDIIGSKKHSTFHFNWPGQYTKWCRTPLGPFSHASGQTEDCAK